MSDAQAYQLHDDLQKIANRLRILSIRATTAAGSGHPTSCASAADLVAALFFSKMRYLPSDPHYANNDRFILSKGHAAPLLYAAWSENGHIEAKQLESLRKLNSPLEGHPTTRLDFIDVATGSLGQGLSAGVGMAVNARMDHLDYLTYVLMGDGEISEGSVWEAVSFAGLRKLSNLIAIVDVNRLGQTGPTAFGDHAEVYQARFESFGWNAVTIDGHDMKQILSSLDGAGQFDRPLAIIARTIKGKGIGIAEDKLNWHGKPLSVDEAQVAVAHLEDLSQSGRKMSIPEPTKVDGMRRAQTETAPPVRYDSGKKVSTRKAFGNALARVGEADPRIVALDGDVANSTFSEEFARKHPERFIECYISEQNMVGIAAGLAALGRIPFVSTFAAFLTRAMDQIRMAGISASNMKLVGTHTGVSIGEDGPSQMGLEDIASFRAIAGSVVLSASDAVSAERLVERMVEHTGICYLRTARPDTPILYPFEEKFEIGGAKVLKESKEDSVTVVATGITVPECLRAYELLEKEGIHIAVIDAYSIKPLARETILGVARRTGSRVITVEDHYSEGGLGDAVAGELSEFGVRVHKLAVYGLPHSGKKDELLSKYKIDAQAIVEKVKALATLKVQAA